MDLSKLTNGDKILGGSAIALVVVLVFLPWQSRRVDGYRRSFTYSHRAIEAPNGWLGVLALLLVLAILTITILRRFTDVDLPAPPRPWGEVTWIAAQGVVALLLLKVIFGTEDLGLGCYLAILLAGAMVYGAFLDKDELDDAPVGSSGGPPPTPF